MSEEKGRSGLFGMLGLSRQDLEEAVFAKAKTAIATGRADSAACELADLIKYDHPEHAEVLFERCMNAGDRRAAKLLAELVKS